MTHVRVHDFGEDWDASDVDALRALRRDGCTIAECAQRLGRTDNAVRSKLYRLSRPAGAWGDAA